MNSFPHCLPWLLSLSILLIGINCISLGDDVDLQVMYQRLGQRIPCNNRELRPRSYQKGRYWVFQNFVAADHGQIDCHSAVTLTATAELRDLKYLVALVRSWKAPISLALYVPGDDLIPAAETIKHLRNCRRNTEESNLIRQYVSFHLFFDAEHITENLPKVYRESPAFCEEPPQEFSTYRSDNHIELLANVPRNIAKDAAITHFIMPAEISLQPSENLVLKFLRMVAFDERPLVRNRVYVVPTFEQVAKSRPPPTTKRALLSMLTSGDVVRLRERDCEPCSRIPEMERWRNVTDSDDLNILTTVKRTGDFQHWQPFFIGPQSIPNFEERHVERDPTNRMTHAFIMCLMDYEYSVLDNVFLVQRPEGKRRDGDEGETATVDLKSIWETITKRWVPQYTSLYGHRTGCHLGRLL